MKILLLLALLPISALAEPPKEIPVETPKYAAVNGAVAVPLSRDNAYLRNPANPAADYWGLASFYIPQRNNASCSSASAAMALNALLNAGRGRGDAEENITEAALVEKVSGVKWKELTSEPGFEGRHGLTVAQLAAASREALAAYGGVGYTVTEVQVGTISAAALESFRRALSGGECSSDDVMLLHFSQSALTGAPGGAYPHISPVGAYDEKNRRVLVFDVDRQWYEPYWAADTQVFRAMAVKTKAFGHGGYVILRRNAVRP